MKTLEFRAMNTAIVLGAEDATTSRDGLDVARSLIEQSEARFSRFRPDSELSMLNRSAGRWVTISEELLDLLQQSLGFYEETGGLFDPSILTDLKRIGYSKSMDEIRAHGAGSTVAPSPAKRAEFRDLEIDSRRRRVRLPEAMEIDLGGIAKGWIVEQAALMLRRYTPACAVSAGGDIVFAGYPVDGSSWRVAVENPMDPAESVAEIQMGPGAIVTSSVAKRSWRQAGMLRHHLIDPRTGEPAASDWLSVTVVAPRITVAEVYAKAILIGGPAQGASLAAQRPEITYYTVSRDGTFAQQSSNVEYFRDLHQTYYQ